MKHMFLRSSSIVVLFVALLVTSCKKGDTGPAGDKGDKGDKGDAGATGATGKAGSANVIYSPWIDVTFNAVDTSFEASIDAPKIVDSIIQKGEVKVFWNLGSASSAGIVTLPYQDNGLILGAKDLFVFPIVQTGKIFIESTYNVGTRPSSSDPNTKVWQYRYVIIPGAVAARSSTNWNDYKQVQQYLGLKD
ncbi:MAG: hypothetical protein ACJ751_21600 [Niastella sp.]|jgi:hypothetical protein|uniref:hypothetical protein n=1 Tax=Niastella sp. TaxID=1869183 RepID=UPI00389B18AC